MFAAITKPKTKAKKRNHPNTIITVISGLGDAFVEAQGKDYNRFDDAPCEGIVGTNVGLAIEKYYKRLLSEGETYTIRWVADGVIALVKYPYHDGRGGKEPCTDVFILEEFKTFRSRLGESQELHYMNEDYIYYEVI